MVPLACRSASRCPLLERGGRRDRAGNNECPTFPLPTPVSPSRPRLTMGSSDGKGARRRPFLLRLLPQVRLRRFSLRPLKTVGLYRYPWETQRPDFPPKPTADPSVPAPAPDHPSSSAVPAGVTVHHIDPIPTPVQGAVPVGREVAVEVLSSVDPSSTPVSQVGSANTPPPARVEAKLKGKAETPRASTSSFEDKSRATQTPDPTKPHRSAPKEAEDATIARSTPAEETPVRASTSTDQGQPESTVTRDDAASLAAFGTPPIIASGVSNDPGKPKADSDVVLSTDDPHNSSSSKTHKPLDREDLHLTTEAGRDIIARVTKGACIHGEWSQEDLTPATFLLLKCQVWGSTDGNMGSGRVTGIHPFPEKMPTVFKLPCC